MVVSTAAFVGIAILVLAQQQQSQGPQPGTTSLWTRFCGGWFQPTKTTTERSSTTRDPRSMRRGLSFVHPSFHSHSDTTKTKPDSMVWISPNEDINNNNDNNDEDALLLQHAHALRQSLSKPGLSQFRVVALLLVDFFVENEDDNHNHPLTTMVIPGANQESGSFLGGAICAERAALLQLRAWDLWQTKPLVTVPQTSTSGSNNKTAEPSESLEKNGRQLPNQRPSIRRIYIVSDAVTEALPPGLLCREYMYGHPATSPETVFVLQSSSSSTAPNHTVWKINLRDLYPFPSIYMKWTTEQQVAFGTHHIEQQQQQQQRQQQPLPNPTLWSWMKEADLLAQVDTVVSIHSWWFQAVLEAAHQATRYDERDDVHPIRYGAAALVVRRNHHHEQQPDDTTPTTTTTTTGPLQIVSARQLKALEYGATQDAVSQLLPQLLPHPPHEDAEDDPVVLAGLDHDKAPNSSNPPSHEPKTTVIGPPLLLVQVDQFGIPHAPFAAARSLLVEHGLGTTPCLLASLAEHQQRQEEQFQDQEEPHSSFNRTTNHSSLTAHIVLAQDLAPYVPNFRA